MRKARKPKAIKQPVMPGKPVSSQGMLAVRMLLLGVNLKLPE